jgi:hypothetical protein
MATPHLQRQHWRKSSQWFALDRHHAALAVHDGHVQEVFHRWVGGRAGSWRLVVGAGCMSDATRRVWVSLCIWIRHTNRRY